MEFREDRWLAAIFGHAVFRIDLPPVQSALARDVADVRDVIGHHAADHAPAMYYAKVDTGCVALVRQLSSAGLYVVDVNVTFGVDTKTVVRRVAPAAVQIGAPTAASELDVLNIAASCFQYSRFHLDPGIPVTVANQIKRDWVLSYLRGQRGDRLFVAWFDGRPSGFLAALVADKDGCRVATIDLIGVGRDSQRRGVGEALVAAFVEHYVHDCDQMRVGTQIANLPSIPLYQKRGFGIVGSAYVMHLHV